MTPKHPRILVLDRDTGEAARLGRRLAETFPGLRVEQASSRASAERLVRAAPPTLIVTSGEAAQSLGDEVERIAASAPSRPAILRLAGTSGAATAHELLVQLGQGLAGLDRLVTSPAFLWAVLDALPEHVAVLDEEGTIITVNAAWKRFADANGLLLSNHAIGANYLAVARDARGDRSEGAQKVADALEALLAGDIERFHHEYACHAPDRQRWFTVRATRTSKGHPVHVVVAHEDVTDCRLAQERVRESEQLFRLMVAGSEQLFFFTLDEQGCFQYLSPSVVEVTGYAAEELSGRPWSSLLSAPQTPPTADASAQGRLRHRRGDVLTVEVIAAPLQRGSQRFGAHGLVRDVSERVALEERLARQAFHDDLTGLPNRALFMDRLEHAAHLTERHGGHHFAVLLMDLDRFKLINDSLGHSTGDLVLVEVARRLQECVRPEDTIARLGGDEFCVLLEDITKPVAATRIAERIIASLREPITVRERQITTGASIGIALSQTGFSRAEDLLRNADVAMYRAKGTDTRHHFYDEAMHVRVMHRLRIETDLSRAVERGELELEYQPIVSLRDQRTVGFEVLVRWRHPQLGLLSPETFIPVAEETGAILPLDWWVLRHACEQLKTWQQCYRGARLRLSVNLSGRQFSHPGLAERVRELLADTGVDPGCLRLEITEGVLIDPVREVADVLQQLRDQRIQLQVDDFGTGYSSLSYLHSFPIDALKIDRSFVSGQGSENVELLGAIVGLAHSLHMDAVAEGIETPEQMQRLQELGCDFGQGFLFSRPLAKAQAERLFQAQGASRIG